MQGVISGIQFSLLSAAEIRRLATIDLTDHTTKRNANAFYDGSFGTVDQRNVCFHCREGIDKCTGHWGVIELPEPLPNPFFNKEIKQILQCFCRKCSTLLYTRERIELNNMHTIKGSERIKLICEILAKSNGSFECPKCQLPVNEVAVKDDKTFIYKYTNNKGNKKNIEIKYTEIYEMFKGINSDDFKILGFNENLIDDKMYKDPATFVSGTMTHRHENSPEDFFITALPVLPLCIRNYTYQGREAKHDDATTLYQLILKDVTAYKKAKKDTEQVAAMDKIQKNIFSLFRQKGDSKGVKKPYNSLHNRLAGKEGHCRGGIESKRANYGARSVVGNAPYLPFGYIEVPQEITKVTQAIHITKYNIDKWNQVLQNDRFLLDKAAINYQAYKKNKMINLTKKPFITYDPVIQYIVRNDKRISSKGKFIKELRLGDIIHRCLQDNDVVIGNRQPTIRKESFNGYFVHVSKDPSKRTICYTLPACESLNMDFDGDESNLHIPQGVFCEAEMSTQMHIINKIMTEQTSTNIVNLTQGMIYCLYLLSRDTTFVSIGNFFNLVSIMDYGDYWKNLNIVNVQGNWQNLMKRANKFYPGIIVKPAKMKKCTKLFDFSKAVKMHGIPGKIVFSYLLPKYYSTEIGVKYEDGKMVSGVKIKNGILYKGELNKKSMNRIIEELYINFGRDWAIHYINAASFLCNTWNTLYGFTFGIQDCLNTKGDEIKQVLAQVDKDVEYIMSMPKTELEKEILIKEVLGKATQIGAKISKDGMVGGINNAMSIATLSGAKGSYINLSYITAFLGLQSVMGNRYAPQLCDGTRTLPCFERNDMGIESRGFIKTNFYRGLDPVALFFHAWSARKGLVDTAVTTRTSGYSHRQFGKKMENARIDQFGTIRDCDGSIIDFCYGEYGFDGQEVYWVYGIAFFIDIPAVAQRINDQWKDKTTPLFKFTEKHIDVLMKQLIIYGESIGSKPILAKKARLRQIITKHLDQVQLYGNKECIDAFFTIIREAFYRSSIAPGNMVGFKATCAIGESSTQDVLDAFHQSGTSNKTSSSGLARLSELTNLTKKPKVNGGSFKHGGLSLEKESKVENMQYVNSIRNQFEYRTFADFCDITIEKLSEDEPTNEFEKMLKIHQVHTKPDWFDTWIKVFEVDEPDLSEGFVIKCTVKPEFMYRYKVSLLDLVDKLDIEDYFSIASPPDENVIYIYPNYQVDLPKSINGDLENWRYLYTRDVCVADISKTRVCGLPGISQIFYSQENVVDYQGCNFRDLMRNKNVDFESLSTSSVWEVYENLGIDAAYIFLFEEFSNCMAKKLNPSHFMLLARTMTNEGILTNVTRNGISEKVGILTKASFETPVDNIISAAIWSKNDDTESLAASYFLGVVGKYGTNNESFQVL